jgi:hypothetical protein
MWSRQYFAEPHSGSVAQMMQSVPLHEVPAPQTLQVAPQWSSRVQAVHTPASQNLAAPQWASAVHSTHFPSLHRGLTPEHGEHVGPQRASLLHALHSPSSQ